MNEEIDQHSKVIKTDVIGRVKIATEDREKMLDAFEASGMSATAFAKEHGGKQQTFATWIQKRRRARGDYDDKEIRRKLRMGEKSQRSQAKSKSSETSPLNFIELDVTASSSARDEPLEVILPNGVSIKVHRDSQIGLLKTLMKELQC